MRDFPIFTTEYGVSSLVLKEIPYRKEAYIRIRDVQPDFFQEHLNECISFCRMCGAERIYAEGSEQLESYPLYTAVYQMRGIARPDEEKVACLFPVTEQTLDHWREIYNEKMRFVDNAAYLTISDAKELLEKKNLYFIHKDGVLIGIGLTDDDKIDCIASVVRGAGREVMLALCHSIFSETVSVEVATTNEKAVRLYNALGFIPTTVISQWYKIL